MKSRERDSKGKNRRQEDKLRRMCALEAAKMLCDGEFPGYEAEEDSGEMFHLLLLPLESFKGDALHHPEGDALYHSLQVFELARQEGYGYDVEFLQAALLHDVGKALDPRHHAEVGAESLEGLATPRVVFLVRHHMDALLLQNGVLGHKKTTELRRSEFFEDLMALRDFDNRGRVPGATVDSPEEALEYLHKLETDWES